ncbi:UNVERIFIED_CONTAM: serine/threonine-protein kinase [Acetivibrio alkalicellulosi]
MINSELFEGKYKTIKILGKGGMSTVYLAENVKLGTLWAIKEIIKDSHSKIDIFVEPNILKKLNHPALPRIFDIFEDEEKFYMIVDYIEGTTLSEEIKKFGKFPEEKVLEWAAQICEVLIYLHSFKPNPIIYRDMKPSNIMLTTEGRIKLIDFGIAREFKTSSDIDTVYIGTKGYAAPEQYGIGQTNERTDIYSLGITLYHFLTGIGPNEPPYQIKPIRCFDLNLSEEFERIIDKCTRQNPEERYESVTKLLEDINLIRYKNLSGEGQASSKNNLRSTPNNFLGTVVVSVAGAINRIGTTHTAISLASFLKSTGFKTALVEMHKSRNFSEIKKSYKNVKEKSSNYFTLDGIDYYPFNGMINISNILQEEYKYMVLDMGIFSKCNMEEFMRSNERIIVSGVKDWEFAGLEEILKSSDKISKNKYYFTFSDDSMFEFVKSNMPNLNCYKAPFNPIPFNLSKECSSVFEDMLHDFFPNVQRSTSIKDRIIKTLKNV